MGHSEKVTGSEDSLFWLGGPLNYSTDIMYNIIPRQCLYCGSGACVTHAEERVKKNRI